MALPKKSGSCSICKKKDSTEWHHITTQATSKEIGIIDLLSSPNNVKELCRICYDQTMISLSLEQKKIVKDEKLTNLRNEQSISGKKLLKRGVLSTTKKHGRKPKGVTTLNKLYPPDHYLHNSNQYNEKESKTFEKHYVWSAMDAGALPRSKPDKDRKVICAKCNRVGHESKDCVAKSINAGSGILFNLERNGLPKR